MHKSYTGFHDEESLRIDRALSDDGTTPPETIGTDRFIGANLRTMDAVCDALLAALERDDDSTDITGRLLDEAMDARHSLVDPEDAARQRAEGST